MRRGPVSRTVRGGLTRRRTQSIGLVLLVSTAACVLGLALVVDSSAPFDQGFAKQHGADVVVAIDPARTTAVQLTATGRLPQVTAIAGPFAQVIITPEVAGQTLAPMRLAGRASPGGPVDDVTLQSGHWAQQPGQVVVASADAVPGVAVGTRLTVTGVPGKPALTIVGVASSITDTADGWVVPSEITALGVPASAASEQVLYRFRGAGSTAAVSAGVAAVTAALPSGAVIAVQSYLSVRTEEASGIAAIAPFLVVFGVIGLVMSVVIVTNVISGAVLSSYHRIGVLKSIGFTPGQVVAAYIVQALVPAVTGCLIGVALGNLLAVPLLARTANTYQVGSLGVPLWVDAAVPVAMCCLTGTAALLPARRAGRLSTVQAIAAGHAPRIGHGVLFHPYGAHRQLARLRLPRPVTIGFAAPFARPARTVATLTAVLFGATAVIFAVGLGSSLGRVVSGLSLTNTEQVQIRVGPSGDNGVRVIHGVAQRRPAVPQALRAQPGTLHFVAESDVQAATSGLAQPISVTAFSGDAAWTGYPVIHGSWYTGPGQVDVPASFLKDTGTVVGDTITIVYGGRQIPVRIVGDIFDTGLDMITDTRTLASPGHSLTPSQYDVELRPGTSAAAYARAVGNVLGPAYQVTVNSNDRGLPIAIGLIGTLTLLLAIVAGLGVLNTVILQTRERVHDLGVFKAIGMTPRQAVVIVICSVAGTGLVAGVIAIPAGAGLQRYVLPRMAAAAGTDLPASFLNVYNGWEVALLALAGMVIAVAGALLPAGWAATTSTASALRAE